MIGKPLPAELEDFFYKEPIHKLEMQNNVHCAVEFARKEGEGDLSGRGEVLTKNDICEKGGLQTSCLKIYCRAWNSCIIFGQLLTHVDLEQNTVNRGCASTWAHHEIVQKQMYS